MKKKEKKHKHQWRKVEATYSKKLGLVTTKKHCIICKKEKEAKFLSCQNLK